MSEETLLGQIKGNRTKVFRKIEIKRRLSSTGLFESDWFDITNRVEKWGKVSKQIDPQKPNKIVFHGMRLVVDNSQGEFNPESDAGSFWEGFLTRQRTLVRITAGFTHQTLGSDGIWTTTNFPSSPEWDSDLWGSAQWDGDTSNKVFIGTIWGDMPISDRNQMPFSVAPLLQLFRDYPAANLTGYNDSITASGFMELVRDATDGAGAFIFRPFFGDTTTNWVINTTAAIYPALSTSTGDDVRDSSVLNVMERLAEAENHVVYVDKDAVFRFAPRDATATVAFNFYGRGQFNNEYGHTIKDITRFGEKHTRFYSRVRVQYREENTSTSFYVREADFSVDPLSTGWQYGLRTLDVNNIWIQTATTAQTLGDALFNELSSLKREIEFKTTFVPHLDVLNRVTINYDSSENPAEENLWDLNNWAPAASEELVWDASKGTGVNLSGIEFKLFQVEIDLDKLECKFVAREI